MGGSGMACWRWWEECSIGRDSLVMAVRCMGQVGMVRHYQWGPLVVLCTSSPWSPQLTCPAWSIYSCTLDAS